MSITTCSAILTIIVALSIQTNGQLPGLSLLTNVAKCLNEVTGVDNSEPNCPDDPNNSTSSTSSTSSTTTEKTSVGDGGQSCTSTEPTDKQAINDLVKYMHSFIEESATQAKTCVDDAARKTGKMINQMDDFMKVVKGD